MMMKRALRIVLVGTGQIATHGHLPAIVSSKEAELVALVDLDLERARSIAGRMGIDPLIVKNLADVNRAFDAAIIATPNHTHASIALDCLATRCHVLIEKPLAIRSEEGGRIVASARENGLVAAVGYCTRFHENSINLKALLDGGFFGSVRRWVYQWGVRNWSAPLTGYSFDRAAAGGGVLMVNGSHFLDRLLHWFGDPDETEYFDDSEGGPESTAIVEMIHRPPGRPTFRGQIRLCKAFQLSNGFVMETDAGVVSIPDGSECAMTFRPAANPNMCMRVHSDSTKGGARANAFRRQLDDFVAACTEGRPPMVSAEEGLRSLSLMESLYSRRRPLEDAFTESSSDI